MAEVNELIRQLAPSDLTVLITGESGTGKDITARLLHQLSPRNEKPFIKVNCPAIPESILESELFGYEKGAFTGAVTSKPGRLELAHGGVIFLDEIAETTLAVQGKLLQVLDGEPILRIGGVAPIECDVRVLAATNVALEEAVRVGRMREDMFYRLSEVQLHLPPLRERLEDLPLLAEHFSYNYFKKLNKPYKPLPEELLEAMQALTWRGNVRELASCVKKYVSSGDPKALLGEETTAALPPISVSSPEASEPESDVPEALPVPETTPSAVVPEPRRFPRLKDASRKAVEETERRLIEEALAHTLWNRRQAAKLLDISYSSLLRRIEAYHIGKADSENH